ncbi:PREDICTED: SPRY domain-containing protein 3 isoform X1 [Chinchilla lanigera]|uniref:SPRY domain-containing protein 3 isoform X1 n=1 Tax=Chinchilla lanigera TaxID=34839 RepID=UPI0006965077|nr:PREDICTED: SPRY domain-containing protein 3 isoform X1 [Chinchilla lanigera]
MRRTRRPRYHGNSGEVGCYVASRPLTKDSNYFEVSIVDSGVRGTIAVGLVPQYYSLDHQPGWLPDSVAYHADDGKLYNGRAKGRQFGSKCNSGDRIGCGIEPVSFDVQTAQIFFTKNGKRVGSTIMPMSPDGLFPAVGMHSLGEEVRLHLNAELGREDDSVMMVDSYEDEWGRLHDVRVCGTLLEYLGKGKSIVDVGLAQARHPLSTRSHYFEVEIVDPGEKCYIALGLARKDYPKNRHPGWSRGSVAYHADDGKIFHGSGVGDPFGPRCYKGDIMGCGIMFPRDYILDSEGDSDDSCDTVILSPTARAVRNVRNVMYLHQEGEEEEEEEEEEEDGEEIEQEHEGKKVVVFFHPERQDHWEEGCCCTFWRLLPHHWNAELRGESQSRPASLEWLGASPPQLPLLPLQGQVPSSSLPPGLLAQWVLGVCGHSALTSPGPIKLYLSDLVPPLSSVLGLSPWLDRNGPKEWC